MKGHCKHTCGWCAPDASGRSTGKTEASKATNEAFCMSDATSRTLDTADSESSDYDDDYEDETTAKVEDYPIPSKAGNYSIYDENGACKVNLI